MRDHPECSKTETKNNCYELSCIVTNRWCPSEPVHFRLRLSYVCVCVCVFSGGTRPPRVWHHHHHHHVRSSSSSRSCLFHVRSCVCVCVCVYLYLCLLLWCVCVATIVACCSRSNSTASSQPRTPLLAKRAHDGSGVAVAPSHDPGKTTVDGTVKATEQQQQLQQEGAAAEASTTIAASLEADHSPGASTTESSSSDTTPDDSSSPDSSPATKLRDGDGVRSVGKQNRPKAKTDHAKYALLIPFDSVAPPRATDVCFTFHFFLLYFSSVCAFFSYEIYSLCVCVSIFGMLFGFY